MEWRKAVETNKEILLEKCGEDCYKKCMGIDYVRGFVVCYDGAYMLIEPKIKGKFYKVCFFFFFFF